MRNCEHVMYYDIYSTTKLYCGITVYRSTPVTYGNSHYLSYVINMWYKICYHWKLFFTKVIPCVNM